MDQADKEVVKKLDDRAFEVANFIHQLGKVQEYCFEELHKEAKEKGWLKDFGVDESGVDISKDWLFDYCFNVCAIEVGITETRNRPFSEYCDSMHRVVLALGATTNREEL